MSCCVLTPKDWRTEKPLHEREGGCLHSTICYASNLTHCSVHGSLPQMTPFLPKSPEAGKLGQPLPFYDGETEAQRSQGWTGSGGLPGCDSHIFSEDPLSSEGWGLGNLARVTTLLRTSLSVTLRGHLREGVQASQAQPWTVASPYGLPPASSSLFFLEPSRPGPGECERPGGLLPSLPGPYHSSQPLWGARPCFSALPPGSHQGPALQCAAGPQGLLAPHLSGH